MFQSSLRQLGARLGCVEKSEPSASDGDKSKPGAGLRCVAQATSVRAEHNALITLFSPILQCDHC
jgi:hypothetical protein